MENKKNRFIPNVKNQALDIKDIVAPASLDIGPQKVRVGEKLAKTFFIISYPSILGESWFSPIINLDEEFDISIFIHPIDNKDALRDFRKKVAEVQSQINERQQKGFVRDPKLDIAHRDLEGLRDKLQQAQEKLFSVGVYVTVYADDDKHMEEIETEIKSRLENQLIYIKSAAYQQDEGFLSTIPLNNDILKIHTKLNSEPLSSIFPFVSTSLSSDEGILYGINRHNASLILFDRFALPNYNSVTFGTSGSGKSYAAKLEVLRTIMTGTDVIIIDPEREFEKLASTVDGRYFNISLNSEHQINPFDLPPVGPGESPADILRENTINLLGLFRILLGGLTPEEDALIDRAITETYALKDITADSDFSTIEEPTLGDFESVISGMTGSDSIVRRLKKFTTGTWAGFINKPSNVNIHKQLVVFSIRDMEEELKPAAMYIITRHIWSAIRKELKKRLLVVDEAWIMMKTKDSASFLFGLVKRGRKYFLGVGTITQDVSDFLNSEFGLPIINNSSLAILLKQSPATIDVVKKTFNLTEEEKFLLLQGGVGEGLFFAGLNHVAVRVVASYTEDQIITSDPAQILSNKETGEK